MGLPITNLKMQDVYYVLNSSSSGTSIELDNLCLSINVNKYGLDPTYCTGSTPDDRLTNLQTSPYHLSYFRNYEHLATTTTTTTTSPITTTTTTTSPITTTTTTTSPITTTTTTTSSGLTSFTSTESNLSSSAACADKCAFTYYHDGSGTYPTTGDYVYSDSGGLNLLSEGYYAYCDISGIIAWYYISNEGSVSSTGSCGGTTTTTTTPTPTTTTTTTGGRYQINCYVSTGCNCTTVSTTVYSDNYSTISQCYLNDDPIWTNSTGYVSPQSGCYSDTNVPTYAYYYWDGPLGEWGDGAGVCGGSYISYLSTKVVSTSTLACSSTIGTIYSHNGSNNYPSVGDTCYTDAYGLTNIGTGYSSFIDSGTRYYIYTSNGLVTSKTTCLGGTTSTTTIAPTTTTTTTSSLTSYSSSSSPNTSSTSACGDSLNATYYHNGSGTYPDVNDFVYEDSAGTTYLSAGYYHIDGGSRDGDWIQVDTSMTISIVIDSGIC